MRHYAHHIGDYRAAAAHLSFIEDAAYRRLLDAYYLSEKPLPLDPIAVQRLAGARTKEERAAVMAVLGEFFTEGVTGWHQARADRELAAYQVRVDIARRNGTKSGGRPKPTGNPSGNRHGYPVGSDTEPKTGTNGTRR